MDSSHSVDGRGWAPHGPGTELTWAAALALPHDPEPPAVRTPEERLRTIVASLAGPHELLAMAGSDFEPLGSVLVFRPWPARSLHVVGQSPLAGEFRRLITAGAAPGWDLHPVPPGRTPLDVLAGPLLTRYGSKRFYSILERAGFACVEEVAATTDECLLELRNSGPQLITAIRAVISELSPASAGIPATGPSPAGSGGPDRAPTADAADLPPDIVPALRVVAAWAMAERGARVLGDLLTPCLLSPGSRGCLALDD